MLLAPTPEGDTDDMEGKWRMIAPQVKKSMTNLFTRKFKNQESFEDDRRHFYLNYMLSQRISFLVIIPLKDNV